ncbi:MAG: preprotein translocase subunit YajC [Micrococcales bacterium]|nr:preprotein translocase subunit YajC [Micrococcales bacterium]
MDQNFLTIALVVVFAIMIFFMFRNSRKRKRDQEEMQSKLLPGAEVMTTHGIFGRLVSIDDGSNEAIIETTPGTRLRLHRQTLSRLVEPVAASEVAADDDTAEPAVDAPTSTLGVAAEPEYGERHAADTDTDTDATADTAVGTAAETPKRAPRKRPAAE